MTKSDLINAVAKRTGMKKKDTAKVIDVLLEAMTDSLKNKEQVSLVGFGTFDPRARNERTGRNPRTGESIHIAAGTACVFRAGRRLKHALSG
jgi:DNA-binding protein HU-beta